MKENYGNLEELKKLGENKTKSFIIEQLLDKELKNIDGENREEVTKRMNKSFDKVFYENIYKRIAIVSHGVAIKFFLLRWCDFNEYGNLVFEGKEITTNSPGIIKLIFEDKKLKNIIQIV